MHASEIHADDRTRSVTASPKVRNALRALPWIVFAMFAFRELELPGAYMDELNSPAFVPAMWSASAADKPHYRLPDNILGNQKRFPVVGGSVYNAEVASYVAAPIYKFWGFTLLTQRLWEIMACATLLLCFQLIARRLFHSCFVACLITCCFAVDPGLTFPVRANAMGFVLVLAAGFGLLLTLQKCWRTMRVGVGDVLCAAACTATAILAYWIAGAVLLGPFLAMAYLAYRSRRTWMLLLATAIFLSPYVYAVVSIYLQAPYQLANWGMPRFAVAAQQSAPVGFMAKLCSAATEFAQYLSTHRPYHFTGATKVSGGKVKGLLIGIALLGTVGDLVWRFRRRAEERADVVLLATVILAPLAGIFFLLVAFASITYHHLLTTLPFLYLAVGYVTDRALLLLKGCRTSLRSLAVGAAPCALILVSVIQQQQVVTALRQTGGAGLFNERIGQIPLLSSQYFPGSVVVFPDWGFHLQFLYLTEGKVPYIAPFADPKTWMPRVLKLNGDILICTVPERTALMVGAAQQAGGVTEVKPITARDGRLVFNFVHATLAPLGPHKPAD